MLFATSSTNCWKTAKCAAQIATKMKRRWFCTVGFQVMTPIVIRKGSGQKPEFVEENDELSRHSPLPDHPVANDLFKGRRFLRVEYIDHSVLAFLRSNQQIWDNGTDLSLQIVSYKSDTLPTIWDVFAREIWPIFATNIGHLNFLNGKHLDDFRRCTSPTVLTDCNRLKSIQSFLPFPDAICDDGPSATADQALSKWLHTPTEDGQPKRLCCGNLCFSGKSGWIDSFKKAFLCATTSANYQIDFEVTPILQNRFAAPPVEPFELVNERTNEKLTLQKEGENVFYDADQWVLERCPISRWTADINPYDLSQITFDLCGDDLGPLSPPAAEKAGQSN